MMNDGQFMELVLLQLVQVTAITLVIGVLAQRLIRQRPHLAHLLILAVLIKCLVPPVIPSPWVPVFTASRIFNANENLPAERVAEFNLNQVTSQNVGGSTEALPSTSRTDAGGSFTPVPVSTRPLVISIVFTTWLMGFLLSGVSMLGPWVAASRRWRTSSNCTRDLQLLCEELSRQLGLLQTVKVVVDPREYGPLATGLWNPTVVLPACLVEANDEVNLRMSMAHELVHLRRYDTAYSVMQCLVRAVWWFHPGVWWIGRLMDQAAERCCDEEVIAALECKPTLYARSLVAILEKKLQVRQVAILPGSRPGGVTADRLACLKKPSSGFCRRTPWQYWLVFFALVFLIVPARPTFSAPDRVETTATTTTQLTQPSEHNDAAAAFSLGEYALAAKQYRQIVEAQPQNAFAWSRLGFSLHALERWDEAMVAHRKASKFPLTQATATYNIACVHSRLGNLDESIKALEKAIELGFRRERSVILQDPDLKTLREHPKFESLVAKASVTKRASRYRDLDFMLGKWQVKDPNGRLLGHSRITKEERGFLLTEKWTAIDGSTGTGITYFDPKLQAWRQTFVGMFGGVINAKGNLVDGTLKMTGDNSRPTRDISLLKTLTEPVAKGAFKFIIDESTDDGITWNRTFNGYYTSDDQP